MTALTWVLVGYFGWQFIGKEKFKDRTWEIKTLDGKISFAKDQPSFSRGPRDESSGHVADYVPAQYGPPAHDLNAMPSEEFTPEGYSTFGANVDYNRLRDYSTARPQERAEEQRFLNK